MKLKGTLGGIAIMLMMGVFYVFAFCMVEDVEAEEISAEYYYTEMNAYETETDSLYADVPRHDKEITAVTAATVSEHELAGENKSPSDNDGEEKNTETEPAETKPSENYKPAETTAEITEQIREKNVSEEDEPVGYDDSIDEEDSFGKDEVPSENNVELDDIEDISDAGETEASQTETVTETEFVPFADDDEDFLALFTELNDDSEEETTTAVSVDVSVGADISTSETFTAKFDGSTHTVNAYDLICWIVNNEMSSSFSDEAIKAQAVAAYSYVKYHNVNGLTPSVLVKKNPPDRIKNLVSEVWGVCCYYNGSVAQTVYMASSSGYTADAKNVWGGSVPYLKSVQCPFDIGNDPNYGSTMKVSESSMRNMLESSLGISLSNNPYNWLKIQSYVDGNYVYELSIDGQKTISGRKLRENVMGHKLKSAAFDVTYRDGEFIFTTYGYGHGVGMSQNGANILAKQGYSYYEILNYYFTGIEII
ncbi:MAG: SpoIID/LytB domain-containing protein [Oscillospiraceae bacterium]|nr:SpoIID/LytB domain-containing protein [Oscillospiraceae bacterium]